MHVSSDRVKVFHVKHDEIEGYLKAIERWNPVINLFGPNELGSFGDRHLAHGTDLASIIPHVGTYADFGTGGGIPGFLVSLSRHKSACMNVLVERDQRKAAFLRALVREFGMGETTKVVANDVLRLRPMSVDFVSARALAPLRTLLRYASLHLGKAGVAYFLKGQRWRDEVDEARSHWHFDMDVVPRETSCESVILVIRGIAKRGRE